MKHLTPLVEENLGEVSSELNFDALTEDAVDLVADLQSVYSRVKAVGDEITKMSEQTNDVELKSVFIDLASSAYQLALDIEEAGQTVTDLKDEDVDTDDLDGLDNLEEIPMNDMGDEEIPMEYEEPVESEEFSDEEELLG